jgi:ribose/xylose/arabinose/galactoside ABC-type transport system permease subunit
MSAGPSRSAICAWIVRPGVTLTLALLAVCAVFAVVKPVFLSPENLVSVLHQVAIIGIMATGMTFVIMTGGIDLSIGPILAVAGVFAAEVLAWGEGNTLLAVCVALGASAAIGAANGLLIAYARLAPFVVTLAGLSMVRGAALLIGGPDLHLIRGPASFIAIGSGAFSGVPLSVLIFAAAIAVGSFVQYGTTFGVSTLAIGANQRAARLSGHRVRFVKMMAYVACATCAGIAGVIQASQVHTAAATYGMGVELDVIAAVVVGGASLAGGSGSVLLTMVGVLLIGVMNNGMGLLNTPIEWQLIAKGLIIVIALGLGERRGRS